MGFDGFFFKKQEEIIRNIVTNGTTEEIVWLNCFSQDIRINNARLCLIKREPEDLN